MTWSSTSSSASLPATEFSPLCLVAWMERCRSKYYQWKDRDGKANEHSALTPRDHWLEQLEKDAIGDTH